MSRSGVCRCSITGVPGLVRDRSTVWLGLEYFCNEGDTLWSLSDENMLALARAS